MKIVLMCTYKILYSIFPHIYLPQWYFSISCLSPKMCWIYKITHTGSIIHIPLVFCVLNISILLSLWNCEILSINKKVVFGQNGTLFIKFVPAPKLFECHFFLPLRYNLHTFQQKWQIVTRQGLLWKTNVTKRRDKW